MFCSTGGMLFPGPPAAPGPPSCPSNYERFGIAPPFPPIWILILASEAPPAPYGPKMPESMLLRLNGAPPIFGIPPGIPAPALVGCGPLVASYPAPAPYAPSLDGIGFLIKCRVSPSSLIYSLSLFSSFRSFAL